MLKSVVALGLVATASADLRMASQPKQNFRVRQRANSVAFVTKTAAYMEPSTFGYGGLNNQRNNNYDNFLRSNIDNEQDNRNFTNEEGKDHLPFRTLELAKTDAATPANERIENNQLLTVDLGAEINVPLRWNNPHSSELEVNVWVANNQAVIPVRKPACSGEGYQNNAFTFKIPTDFNTNVAATVPGFTGCKAEGDCVLQVYSHSVESRTYAIGTPLIINGNVPANTAPADWSAVQEARRDIGTDLSKLSLVTCLPSSSNEVHINTAVPRKARQVSDVFSHTFQDSNYSPYSGQQPDAISQNLQASAILKMATANGGELGRRLLSNADANARAAARRTANRLVVKYEQVANKVIAALGGTRGSNELIANSEAKRVIDANQGQAKPSAAGNGNTQAFALINSGNTEQGLANCPRCLEVGSTKAQRLTTNTYIPSFVIPAASVQKALAAAPVQYKKAIQPAQASGVTKIQAAGGVDKAQAGDYVLQIYKTALGDLQPKLAALAAQDPTSTYMMNTAFVKDLIPTDKAQGLQTRAQAATSTGNGPLGTAYRKSNGIDVATHGTGPQSEPPSEEANRWREARLVELQKDVPIGGSATIQLPGEDRPTQAAVQDVPYSIDQAFSGDAKVGVEVKNGAWSGVGAFTQAELTLGLFPGCGTAADPSCPVIRSNPFMNGDGCDGVCENNAYYEMTDAEKAEKCDEEKSPDIAYDCEQLSPAASVRGSWVTVAAVVASVALVFA